MIKDMYDVMQRINEIKQRFGLKKPLQINKHQSTINYQKIHDKALADITEKNVVSSEVNKDKKNLTKSDINQIVELYSERNRVPASLVKAMIKHESSYNPRAVSPRGAMGLMQLMPSTAKEAGVEDPFSPEENIKAGTTILSRLLNEYNGDYKRALAAYNAGSGAVESYQGVPDYPETKQYVKKVIQSYLSNK